MIITKSLCLWLVILFIHYFLIFILKLKSQKNVKTSKSKPISIFIMKKKYTEIA